MPRARISTTIDAARVARARDLCGCRDSELLDRALDALIDREERRREQAAFENRPYEEDPDLDMPTPDAGWDAELPYDGGIPVEVLELARQRRAARS